MSIALSTPRLARMSDSRQHICYIISDVDSAREFEWALVDISRQFCISAVLITKNPNTPLARFCERNGIPVTEFIYANKVHLLFIVLRLAVLLRERNPFIIHCHLLKANIIGMAAGLLANTSHRIHTRHHSDFHHVYHKKGVVLDKLVNLASTKIVSISKVVSDILIELEGVPRDKLVEINHGIDPRLTSSNLLFSNDLALKYDLQPDQLVVGVVSRFTEWKGIHFIIPAFNDILRSFPNACLVLANANGEYESHISKLLTKLPPKSFRLISYEDDIRGLFSLFTVFIHVPISPTAEAFGQVYIEALSMGVVSIMTKSGIGHEILQDRVNCIVVPYCNSAAITDGIRLLVHDKSLFNKIKLNAPKHVSMFTRHRKSSELLSLYSKLLQ